jgi:fructose-1,6-bisphosphatase/inositol monophosphatase family enzyme
MWEDGPVCRKQRQESAWYGEESLVDIAEISALLDSVEALHREIRSAARAGIREQARGLAKVMASGNGDVSYGIDVISENIIDRWFTEHPPEGGAAVVCEGLGHRVYPGGTGESDAKWRILIDPLDGTRHIMYDSRSAWVLTGIAPNRGPQTTLGDICAAIQTEVPVMLQDKGAVLKAIKRQGADLKISDLSAGREAAVQAALSPSTAATLENGFSVFVNLFPGTKVVISELEERVLHRLYGSPTENSALVFSEQYISTAGQLFMLMSGKYRMVIDIRGLLRGYQEKHGQTLPLCAHPYDLSAALIAMESGCIVRDTYGGALDSPMDLNTNCSWAGYANAGLYKDIHPVVLEELKALSVI